MERTRARETAVGHWCAKTETAIGTFSGARSVGVWAAHKPEILAYTPTSNISCPGLKTP